MSIEELDYSKLDKYYFENINLVELIDIVRIKKDTFNKIDLIMFRYYPETEAMKILPLILTFNNLPDITNIPIGTILKIPDLYSLLQNLIILDDNEENIVQGVNKLGLLKNKNIPKSNKTTALPKLNITLEKTSYDNSTGIIKY
jgi:hypothetical protein